MEGTSNAQYSEANSYGYSEHQSYRRGRDARTGRYVSRDRGSYDDYSRGYSRHTEKERMIEKLEDMMEDAVSEKEKRAIQRCIDQLES